METDLPDSSSEFESLPNLISRLLRREDPRRRQLRQKEAEFFALRQVVRLEQQVAQKLGHPSVGNLTWLQVKALKLWDEIEALKRELE